MLAVSVISRSLLPDGIKGKKVVPQEFTTKPEEIFEFSPSTRITQTRVHMVQCLKTVMQLKQT